MQIPAFLSLVTVILFALPLGSASAARKPTGVPRFDPIVDNAVKFLIAAGESVSEREKSLVAYALLKSGEPVTSPTVAAGIQSALERANGSNYQGYDHIYLSGVDAMLLADTDPDAYFQGLQNIANYIQSTQQPGGSWSDAPQNAGDVSMTQYGLLGIWSAQRAGCQVSGSVVDKAAGFLMKNGNQDGGWGYRPGTSAGPGRGGSTHNMVVAAAGTLAIARTLLHGPKAKPTAAPEQKFGVLVKVETQSEAAARRGEAFPGYSPQNGVSNLDGRIARGIGWVQSRFTPISKAEHKIYFYYALERAAALADLEDNWFETYGDGLMTLQSPDGSFATHSGANVGTSFAVLYYMRSTRQILDKQYGAGIQMGGRDLNKLMNPNADKKKDIGPLDELLSQMENVPFDQLDVEPEQIVEKIQFGSRDELIGQVELLKKLLTHPDPANRQAAYFALGRTGDFSLVPLMLKGLRDPSVAINTEALMALRYISRKPNGFGLSIDPLEANPTATGDERVRVANQWRDKAYKAWSGWYFDVRPYSETDGLDELLLLVPSVD